MEQDNRWKVFLGVPKTFEEFAIDTVPPIFLKEAVHEDVKNSFKIIKKLLDYSFFEYEFFDVAATKAMLTLEMACKLRYEELTGEVWSEKKPLKQLFDWLDKGGYFEVSNDMFLDHLRSVRNHMAHPKNYGFAGPMIKHLILGPMDLINGMYEDIEKRKQRFGLFDIFEKAFDSICENGAIITLADGTRLIIFKLDVIFINNKLTVAETTFWYHPIFEIPEKDKDGHLTNVFSGHELVAIEIEIDMKRIKGKLKGGGEFKLEPIIDSINRGKFDKWMVGYKTYDKLAMNTPYINFEIGKAYNECHRAFHRM